jgi:spermidine/putrescine transport system permease protein
MNTSQSTKIVLFVYGLLVIFFLYLPLVSVTFASVSKARYLSFPIKRYSTKWYADALESSTVSNLLVTSFSVAVLVTIISIVIAFFGALAFARYEWRYRTTFQKLILLPIFFPQTVLGLSLLMWFNSLGIIPSWKTAVVAHLVWIAPIATLIVAILREITLPLLLPGLVSAGLFAFLLSWGNFPLSLFTTGADSTLPEWLYAKMVSGYSPLVPTLGVLSVIGSFLLILAALFIFWCVQKSRENKEVI